MCVRERERERQRDREGRGFTSSVMMRSTTLGPVRGSVQLCVCVCVCVGMVFGYHKGGEGGSDCIVVRGSVHLFDI